MTTHREKIKQLNHELLEELMSTLFQLVEGLRTDVDTLKNSPATGVTADQLATAIAPVEAQVTALAALIGTPSAPSA